MREYLGLIISPTKHDVDFLEHFNLKVPRFSNLFHGSNAYCKITPQYCLTPLRRFRQPYFWAHIAGRHGNRKKASSLFLQNKHLGHMWKIRN
jgi:hypothetical protein